MFADLLDKSLLPDITNIEQLPEFTLSQKLASRLQNLLEHEEKYARIYSSSVIVKTDNNYVFFPTSWLYLAVICKKYATALYPYCEFFDSHIRPDLLMQEILKNSDYDNPAYTTLFPDKESKEQMRMFIVADDNYRPGKAIVNIRKDHLFLRSSKDVFGSCILKKLPVPDASSDYLGTLIYYLAQHKDLYDELEYEICSQIKNTPDIIQLPKTYRDCAQSIIDYIYGLDRFGNISALLDDTGKYIKIKTTDLDPILPQGNYLRYVFAKPEADLSRTFTEKEYMITLGETTFSCRLTTEWKGSEIETENENGNYLSALITIVNEFYKDKIVITNNNGTYFLRPLSSTFTLDILPSEFHTDYARRFITSLLAKPFVILTGNSGTGKTRIAKQFAEYCEYTINDTQKNWELIPVGADWTDNTKLLGFFNPLANDGKGNYVSTTVLNLLERANQNPDIPFFLILDEMNLSHVERYFADFLSHMETSASKITLDGYEQELIYPDNLFVIGTVNIDETTYMFSPKVLDRANVIEFKPDCNDVIDLFDYKPVTHDITPANKDTIKAFLCLAKQIRNGNCSANLDMSEVKETYKRIYEIVEKTGFEFAYRTVREIRQYLSAAYELSNGYCIISKVMDEQLLQKILPKIHGNRKEIEKLLDELEEFCSETCFNLSETKIKQMKGKLATVQYASFI